MMRWRNPMSMVILTIVFIVSRILAYGAGVRMVMRPLYQGIQVLDPILLQNHLLESLIHLHSQPPLFNLFLGIILKAFPDTYIGVFQIIFWGVGYAMIMGLYVLMRRLDIPNHLSLILTAYFCLNPALILLENWLMYTHFIMAVLIWSAVFLHRYLSESKNLDGFVFFGLMGMLVLTKGIFHILWYVMFVGVLMISRRVPIRSILTTSLIPLLLISGIYFKNFVLFGSLTTSKVWMVFNLGEMAVKHIRDDQLIAYCRNGDLNFTTCERFLGSQSPEYQRMLEKFNREVGAEPTNVPVLDQVFKPTSGHINWHSRRFLKSADYALEDSLFMLRNHPESYLKSLRRAFRIMFYPAPTDVTFANRQYLKDYEDVYNFPFIWANYINQGTLYSDKLLLWNEFEDRKTDIWSKLSYFVVIFAYLTLFMLGVNLFVQAIRMGAHVRIEQVMLFFLLFNIFYLPVASNLFSWVASNRYRFVIEPFNLVVLGMLLAYYFSSSKSDSMDSKDAS